MLCTFDITDHYSDPVCENVADSLSKEIPCCDLLEVLTLFRLALLEFLGLGLGLFHPYSGILNKGKLVPIIHECNEIGRKCAF